MGFLPAGRKFHIPDLVLRPADAILRDNGFLPPISNTGIGSTYQSPLITSAQVRQDPYVVQGATGTVFFGGILKDLQEYNPDVADDAWYDVAERMFRSSAAVRSVTACIMLPLLRATWAIRPPSDPNDEEVKVAQECQDQVFSGMSKTWRSTLTEILLSYLKFGFYTGEKIWAPGDKGYGKKIDRIATRLARTHYRWYVDPATDDLDRIQQRVWVPDPTGTTGTWKFPMLYHQKFIRFVHQREGNNFRGISLYRHMYADWYYQDTESKLNAIALERNGMGFPWFDMPEGAQESDKMLARRVLESIHVHEQMYGMSPAGWQFDIKTSSGGKEALPSIEHHNRQIFLTGLCTFAIDTGGSYAKSQDLSTFFTEAEFALAEDLGEVIDRHLLREIVDFNHPDFVKKGNRYPTAHVSGIDRRQVGTWLRSLAQLFAVGALTRDDQVENTIREWFDFNDLPINPFGPPEHERTVETGSGGVAATAQTQAETINPNVPNPGRGTTVARPGAGEAGDQAGGASTANNADAAPYLDDRLSETAAVDLWRLRRHHATADFREHVERLIDQAPEGISRGEWTRIVLREADAALSGGA